jgi:hypothetical protein
MDKGVKLYRYFEQELTKIGTIKRAWFTTFNLDISFVEKYLLSILTGNLPSDLKIPQDYEIINDRLAGSEVDLNDDKLEFKIFYDYRALMSTGRGKQTTAALYPIDVKQLNSASLKTFEYGVFHPKISLLEGYDGRFWLMVSSANLTFGGWSKNRECFFFEELKDQLNIKEVLTFFEKIVVSENNDSPMGMLKSLEQKMRMVNASSNWQFHSSFSSASFVDRLTESKPANLLSVWSPYFTTDLNRLITENLPEIDRIQIIPNQSGDGKIRITQKNFENSTALKKVEYKQEKLAPELTEFLVHAKVWLTDNKIAIGSWNMTEAGINASEGGGNNVEAGIINSIDSLDIQELTNHLTPLNAPTYSEESELKDEKEDLILNFPVVIDLILNWDSLLIELASPSFVELMDHLHPDALLELPGLGTKSIQELKDGINCKEAIKSLVTNRFYKVILHEDVCYSGYFREIGFANRPTRRFENLDDFMKGWVNERPEDKQELQRLFYSADMEGYEMYDNSKQILSATGSNAWFMSFYAFECISNRLNETLRIETPIERKKQLKKIGRVLPGSLTELSQHLSDLLTALKTDPINFKKSPIYLWFLIEKTNVLLQKYNELMQDENESLILLENLSLDAYLSIEDPEIARQWKSYIHQLLKSD